MSTLLRRYVRSILNEMSYEDVKTSKDPADWVEAAFQDPEDWDTDDPFRAMIRAAKKFGLEELGIGSSRFVFSIDGERVLKIARNQKGVEQNKLELTAGRDAQVHDLLSSVYESSPEYAWLIAEAVEPLDDGDVKRAEELTGVPWIEVRRLLGLSDKEEFNATAEEVTSKLAGSKGGSRGGGTSCLRGAEFITALGGFLDRYRDMLPGDIVKLSSWGVNKKGCLVLLDYGITRKKFEEFYR